MSLIYNIVNVCVYNSAVYSVHCSEKALRIKKNDKEFVKAPSVESSSADLKANTHTTHNHGARPTTHIFKNLHSRVENYPPFSLCILFTQCDLQGGCYRKKEMAKSLDCLDHDPLERLTHRPPQRLVSLCRENIVLLALKAVRRIQSGSKLGWLGWPFTCIPNFEPKAFKRHGIRQLQIWLSSVPHMYNEIALEMFKREPNR